MKIISLILFNNALKILAILRKGGLCKGIDCSNEIEHNVCGIKEEGSGFRIRLFENECALLKYGCAIGSGKEYGLINKYYCDVLQLKLENPEIITLKKENRIIKDMEQLRNTYVDNNTDTKNIMCKKIYCVDNLSHVNASVCAIRKDGDGFRLRKFPSTCYLHKFNCLHNLDFKIDDNISCSDIEMSINSEKNLNEDNSSTKFKNIIVINGTLLDFNGNVNDTIDDFFASTHYINMPLQELYVKNQIFNNTRRGRLLKIAGPIKIFEPWINIPKQKFDDRWHAPTLSSCYHRCPEKCPDTYAPVCGVPGIVSREPSLMFQNHCFMDKAQCKMAWEDKSETSSTSAYVESSFMFCLGDQLNGLYRFLPVLRTLQHMGRLKRKGVFRYRLQNLRFFNHYLIREPKIMG